MKILFGLLSIAYITVIFLYADSSLARDLGAFNPYSLLHIPLYGILSLLLFLSIAPPNVVRTTGGNVSVRMPQINTRLYCLIVGLIGLGVAVSDEYYQSFVPGRHASVGDVVLDLIGIILSMLLTLRFYKNYSARHGFQQ